MRHRPGGPPPGVKGLASLSATLPQALYEAEKTWGQAWFIREVLESGGFRDISRREFLDLALRVGAWCLEQGLDPGDRAVLCLENSPAWGALYFGVLLAGGVVVPIDTASSKDDAAYYLERTSAKLIFASSATVFAENPPEKAVLCTDWAAALAHAPLAPENIHQGRPQSLACLVFTSGTTGYPKAVMLSHANLLANVAEIDSLGLVRQSDNFLSVLPLHHSYPCMVNLIMPLVLGARVTYPASLKPEAILTALNKGQVSILVLTPQYAGLFYRRILKRFQDLPLGTGRALVRLLRTSLAWPVDPLAAVRRGIRRTISPRFRYFVTGGAKCEPQTITGMAELGLTLLEGYGLSEAAPVISINPPGAGRPGSVGPPLRGMEARIANPDDEGWGEIQVAGANVMSGYWRDEQATARALDNGWLRTGDQGRLDRDGYLYVRGRERDIIVLGSGKKFSAEEVEDHYRQAPSVADIAVLPGPGGGLEAVVVPDLAFMAATDSPDIKFNIRWDLDYLSQSLPPYKRIKGYTIITGELPKTRLGKLKRHEVEKLLEAHGQAAETASPDQAWPALGGNGLKALRAIREVAGLSAVAPSAHLELDLGLDSLKRVELLALLEDHLRACLDEESFLRLNTAQDVVNLAERSVTGPARIEAVEGQGDWKSLLEAPLDRRAEAKVRLLNGPGDRLATALLAWTVDLAARIFFRLETRGAGNIPEGRAIICPNHASYLDGFMILAALPPRRRLDMFFLGLARFFEAPVIRRLAVGLRLIPVSAGKLSENMRLSAHVLRHGKLLCLFPEGGRTLDGTLREFRKGAAILAREISVPVVPVAIKGTYEAWPAGGRPKLGRVSVTFGPAISPQELAAAGDYEASAGLIRDRVAGLLATADP